MRMKWPVFKSCVALVLSQVWRVAAREDVLFTSSVTYCSRPDAVIVEEFDVTYFKSNASVSFSISATSVTPDLKARASITLVAYGQRPVNLTFDFCNILGGALCPLPLYNFTGNAEIPLPPSFKLDIPEIAYRIPDLEAFAQMTLVREGSGETVACVQSTLSNGWSMKQHAVADATGTFALLSLLAATLYGFWRPFTAPEVFRVLDVFAYFQHIAMTAMLHLNYPFVYISFVSNFAWSFGLFEESGFIQSGIEDMRRRTGSKLPEGALQLESYSNRRLSPYNLAKAENSTDLRSAGVLNVTNFVVAAASDKGRPPATEHNFITPATIQYETDTLPPGLPVFVNSVDVATGNAFMATFFTLLFYCAAAILASGVVWLLLRFYSDKSRQFLANKVRPNLKQIIMSNGLRMVLIFFAPVLVLALFEFTLHDSWLAVLIAVITMLSILGAVGYAAFLIMRVVRSNPSTGVEQLYQDKDTLRSLGVLYGQYRMERYYFHVVVLVSIFVKACIIAFGDDSGFVQVVTLFVLEFFLLLAFAVLLPGRTKGSDSLAIFLSLIRLLTTGGLIAFVRDKLAVEAIPRVAVGIVLSVIHSVAIIVLFVNFLVISIPWRRLFRRSRRRPQEEEVKDTCPRDEEKGNVSPTLETPTSDDKSANLVTPVAVEVPAILVHPPRPSSTSLSGERTTSTDTTPPPTEHQKAGTESTPVPP